jgi:hypothetical protein
MKRNELESIYAVACAAKGFQPNDSQFKVWWKTLGVIKREDLEAALMAWFSTHADFPMPVELRIAADNVHSARVKMREYHQQQVCPKCNSLVEMMRPIGEQFRTWCLPCQSYRKIIPEDLTLTDAEWQMLCVELSVIFDEWVKRGMKYHECVDPQFDRERVRSGFSQAQLPIPAGLR